MNPSTETAVLASETREIDALAASVEAMTRQQPSLIEVIGVGIGGGADALLALLCRHPRLFAGAILCKPSRNWSETSPRDTGVQISGVEVLVIAEQIALPVAANAIAMLSSAGHRVTLSLTVQRDPMEVSSAWLRNELLGEF